MLPASDTTDLADTTRHRTILAAITDVPDTTTKSAEIGGSVSVTLDNTYGVDKLTFTGDTIGGANSLTIASLEWTRGTLKDAGTTTVTGNATLMPLNLNNDLSVNAGRTLAPRGNTSLGPSINNFGP